MSAIKNKIRSRRGASITFALLLFLVCAVISSVVIVAASTAGGRVSGLSEMDQRYYAATSAAETLRDLFDGKTVTVPYTKNGTTITVDSSAGGSGLLGEATRALVAQGSMSADPVTITRTVNNIDYECSITKALNQTNSLLCFDIAASGGRISQGTYLLKVYFSPSIMEVDSSAIADATTETGKAKVTWKLNRIEKVRS